MPVHKLSLTFSDRTSAHAVAGLLQEVVWPPADALSVFEERGEWRVDAFYDDAPDPTGLSSGLDQLLGAPLALPPMEVVPDLDWVALSQAALPPVRAGRFRVYGEHDRARIARGPGAIRIDAGQAFGTAHHATTFGCLLAIDRLTRRRAFRRVLDLGCGSGVLAIAAARAAPRASIVASDMDRDSARVAAENARLNGAASRVTVVQAHGLAHPALRGARFDLVVANILAAPLIELAPALVRVAAPAGALVLSGLLTPQAPGVIAAYRAMGCRIESHDRLRGWSVLTLAKRAQARRSRL